MSTDQMSQYCTFYLGDLYLGVNVLEVQEVLKFQEMTRVPLASREIRGLINLRGQTVTAIDLRRRVGLPDRPSNSEGPYNVIIRTEDGIVSLLVDEIDEVLEVREADFEEPPANMKGLARELVTGVYKLAGRLLIILDLDQTIAPERSKLSARR